MDRDAMRRAVGTELALSDWVVVDQARIDAFAQISGDQAAIHLDPVRGAEVGFGGTVAQGMLSLSLLTGLAFDALPQIDGQQAILHYGFDQVRFLAPVRAGARVRGRYVVAQAMPRGRGDLMVTFAATLEVEGAARPAVTAGWQLLYRF